MKLSNKYIAFASVALLMASCDLDKFPEGDYISEEQKEDIINGRPNLITAEVNAMAAKLNTFGTISDDATTYHNDYGIPMLFTLPYTSFKLEESDFRAETCCQISD